MASITLVRLLKAARSLGIVGVLCLAAGCGGSSTAPSMTQGSVTVATGPQVLRVTGSFRCTVDGTSLFPMVYTRVTVSKVGDEWLAVAAAPEGGDVEVRFHQTGAVIVGSMPVEGTIRGQANHQPEAAAFLPPSNSRMAFGGDGRTTITGFAFGPSSLTPAAGLDGVGTGPVTLSDNTGHSCAGTTFSWSLAAER